MSSLNKSGTVWRIQFVDASGKRQTLRLGKIAKRSAEAIHRRIERIIEAAILGLPIEADLARWLATRDDGFTERLVAVGLVRRRQSATLGAFLSDYISRRQDASPNTLKKYRTTEKALVAYFGEQRQLRDISVGDAEDFRRHLGNGRAENTIRKFIANAKVYFEYALHKGLIDENPFRRQATTIHGNPSRYYFVSTDDAAKVLDACPDHHWRLLFALARWGGLRTPSEPRELTWADVDWERKRLTVRAPKTVHQGKPLRVIPLFPELEPVLTEAFERAEDGEVFVLPMLQVDGYNPRTSMARIVERACGSVWEKLFQNCRSTRQTELERSFPNHVVCAWLGNSPNTAKRFYLQVTDHDFDQAL